MLTLENFIRAIATDIKSLFEMGLNSIGVEKSRLMELMEVKVQENEGDLMFNFIFPQYIEYIESGRAKGHRPPISDIEHWCKRHNLPTDNSTLWAIAQHIANQGIRPRPFLASVFDEIDKHWNDEWSQELFELIIDILAKYFNNGTNS